MLEKVVRGDIEGADATFWFGDGEATATAKCLALGKPILHIPRQNFRGPDFFADAISGPENNWKSINLDGPGLTWGEGLIRRAFFETRDDVALLDPPAKPAEEHGE